MEGKTTKQCEKCKERKATLMNRNKPLCNQCFLAILNHKFKSNLRTNCKIRHEDHVLVCISGDNNSMAMLNLFYKSFNESITNRKLFFKLQILHIDDSLFYKEKELIISNRNQRLASLKALCTKYNFNLDAINLEHAISLSTLAQTNLSSLRETNMEYIVKYLAIYDMLNSNGGYKKKFNEIMTQNLIFYYSINNNYLKIIYSNCGQTLVSDLFSDIISGRGNSIPDSVDYCDTHYLFNKIQILKPMKDFFTKEILLYNYINKIDIIYPSNNEFSKMDMILNGFFTTLQKQKMNTVPSVINTTEKLVKLKNDNPCRFCLNLIDNQYSKLAIGNINNENNVFNKTDLCFGCRRMFYKLKVGTLESFIPSFANKNDDIVKDKESENNNDDDKDKII